MPIPNPVVHGTSLHEELALLIGVGLTEVDALRAATAPPAQCLGLTDRGAIRHIIAAGFDVLRKN